MRVFKMRLVMGKEAQYDANGKLKNKIITPDYHGEKELADLLEDQNWRKLGACDISCVSVYDTKAPEKIDKDRVESINKEIKDTITGANKPKTEAQLLKEQNEMLIARLEALENGGKTVNDNVEKSNDRIALENKANDLKIQFRSNIGDEKLLEKINEIEPEFKL